MGTIDLYVGVVIMLAVSSGLFLLGRRIAILGPRWLTNVLAILTIAGVGAYAVYLRDNMLMAIMLPYSNLIVLGNWFPVGVGFLGGLAWIRVYGGRVRKGIYTAVLLAVGLFALLQPLLGSPPECNNEWLGEVCIQTSDATCSAASAATVLVSVGIDAEESELARLSLTRHGTSWQGLYRGLKLKTAGTKWDVEVFQCTADELRDLGGGPKILAVGLKRGSNYDPKYVDEYGWIPGQLHSVVLFNFMDDGRVRIGEPTQDIGVEYWSPEDLQLLWRGIGLRLVPRQ
ncbi:MAG: hypothetical protein HON53_03450 [Planctomycetaceae bacterium]|jgi:hypothetical protein|nr:hypothetical protein [Planctomycetaceae bacterium]MBT6156408.1 hypothetical protein [Planctomycetaceae bacterium]MBT6487978.1 hypothetical protein [Planctomycetaceae bacterium]MBT6495025.1 hypothetical protein [Planctomycetaceae bacterium]